MLPHNEDTPPQDNNVYHNHYFTMTVFIKLLSFKELSFSKSPQNCVCPQFAVPSIHYSGRAGVKSLRGCPDILTFDCLLGLARR